MFLRRSKVGFVASIVEYYGESLSCASRQVPIPREIRSVTFSIKGDIIHDQVEM